MKNKQLIFLIIFLGMSHSAYALDQYACSKTFRTVRAGDSMETVKEACGEPTSTTARTDEVSTPVQVMRWVYSMQPDKRRLPIPVFSVSFQNEKLIQIERNDTLVSLFGIFSCLSGDMLKVGLSSEEVLALCGPPSASVLTETAVSSTKAVVVWTYDPGQFQPKIEMDFEDSKLARIRRIQ